MEVMGMDDRVVKGKWRIVGVYSEVLLWLLVMLTVLLLIGLVEMVRLWRGRGWE